MIAQLSDIQRRTLLGYEEAATELRATIWEQEKAIRKLNVRVKRLENIVRFNVKNGESFL